MNPLSWIVFGLILAMLAALTNPRLTTESLISATILGIAGAVLGGLTASVLLGQDVAGFSLVSLLVAASGAAILLSAGKFFQKGGQYGT